MGLLETKRKKWKEIIEQYKPPPQYEKWSDTDEANLEKLKSKEVDMADTALERVKNTSMRQFTESFKSMAKDKQDKWLEELKNSKKVD